MEISKSNTPSSERTCPDRPPVLVALLSKIVFIVVRFKGFDTTLGSRRCGIEGKR
jgi:hypothetical protein